MTKLIEWFEQSTDKSLGKHNWGESEDPICPLCGKESHYWEGMVDQDRMGNDIEACHWLCWDDSHDPICTNLVYLD